MRDQLAKRSTDRGAMLLLPIWLRKVWKLLPMTPASHVEVDTGQARGARQMDACERMREISVVLAALCQVDAWVVEAPVQGCQAWEDVAQLYQ